MDLSRKCDNWLASLAEYVEETETPRHFWFWGGVFTIGAALQRKVWLPYGLDPLYPNMYIMLVAPPGKCRKGAPLRLAKKMLETIDINVAVDSQSRRNLTKELDRISRTGSYILNGEQVPQAAMAIVSLELSSLLAIDPKGMLEVLTDLYDSQDDWVYGTFGQGKDTLKNVCVCCFIGTTPIYISQNLPQEALYGGWASRTAVIAGSKKYKRVPVPPQPPTEIYDALIHDLGIISKLVGEFKWGVGAEEHFKKWYNGLDSKYKEVKDERLHSFLERIHVMVLKTAMALHVAYSNKLVVTVEDVAKSIHFLEDVLGSASDAFGGMGRSKSSVEVEAVLRQLAMHKVLTFRQLLRLNHRNVSKKELYDVMETVVGMGDKVSYKNLTNGDIEYTWKEKEDDRTNR